MTSKFARSIAGAAALLPFAAAAQQAAPQNLSRAEFIAQMDAQFTSLDADQDGVITATEIEQRRAQLQQAVALQINRSVFQELDQDRNGALSPEEFSVLANPQAVSAVPVPTVAEFDADGDGSITLVEYRVRTQSNFDRLDQDRDGVMSAAEMQAAGLPGS